MLQRVNVIKVGEMIRTKRLGAKRTGREKTWGAKQPVT